MPIVKTMWNPSELYHDLKAMGREPYSYHGAAALFEYLEELADDTLEPIEYDPIAWVCEFVEWENLDEFRREYGADEYPDMEAIEAETMVVYVDDPDVVEAGNGRFITGSL